MLIFNVTNYMALSYLPSYLSATLKFNEMHGLFIMLVVMVLMMPLTLLCSRLSDAIGRKPVMLAGCVGLLLLSIPALSLIRMGTIPSIFPGMMILGALLSTFTSVMPSSLPALFPTKIRYGALAIGFNVSVLLFGGTTPLVTAWLVEKTGMLMMPAYYLMGVSVIGIVSVIALHESAKKPLKGSPPAVASHSEARRCCAAIAWCRRWTIICWKARRAPKRAAQSALDEADASRVGFFYASSATVTGNLKRRGPALPGFTYSTPSRRSMSGLCE